MVLLVGRGRCAVGFARVVARWSARPRHGQGRSGGAVRPCPPFGLQTAARLAEAFLADVEGRAREVDPGAALRRRRGRRRPAAARFRERSSSHARTSLGAALHHAARPARCSSQACARESLRPSRAAARARALDPPSPSLDGGYCGGPGPAVPSGGVHGVSWSTPSVLTRRWPRRARSATVGCSSRGRCRRGGRPALDLHAPGRRAARHRSGATLPRKAPASRDQRTLQIGVAAMVLDRLPTARDTVPRGARRRLIAPVTRRRDHPRPPVPFTLCAHRSRCRGVGRAGEIPTAIRELREEPVARMPPA